MPGRQRRTLSWNAGDVTILLNPWSQQDEWFEALSGLLPDEEIILWPHNPDPEAVEMLIAWRMKRSDMATLANLKTIFSMGAGVDQWLRDGSPEVQLVRLADPAMADEMAAYALHWVVHHQRGFSSRFEIAGQNPWGVNVHPVSRGYRVGLLGFGQIGRRIGGAFADLGYQLRTWTRSGVDDEGITSYSGVEELEAFLGDCDAVINILPNTPSTAGLLTAERFAQFVPGATFINMGRGTVVADEAELVGAINAGHLGAVVLDVTSPEPPSPDAPILSHPGITVTPHISGMTQMGSAAQVIADNIDRIRRGEDPFPVVDRSAGY